MEGAQLLQLAIQHIVVTVSRVIMALIVTRRSTIATACRVLQTTYAICCFWATRVTATGAKATQVKIATQTMTNARMVQIHAQPIELAKTRPAHSDASVRNL